MKYPSLNPEATFLSEILTDLSPPALSTAIEANLFLTMLALFRSPPQVEVHNGSDMIRIISGVPHAMLNWVLRAHLAPTNIDRQITETMTPFKTHHLPMLWITGPSTRPTNLGEYLEAHGLTHTGDSPGLAVDLRELNENVPPPSNLAIQRVNDVPTLKRWLHPFSIGFGLPDFAANVMFESLSPIGFSSQGPLQHYVGLVKDNPVASSSLLLGAGVAGVYNVATIPAARRQGIGAALTLAALRDAQDRGYRIGVLNASQMGVGLYQQLGFREYCTFGFYLFDPPPPPTTPHSVP